MHSIEVTYLALAHNEHDPKAGMPKAEIVHNFGRADLFDPDGLRCRVAEEPVATWGV